ncbi:hypothetical protein B0H13DRAFT_1941238 [Mycena leptocephala]|nr:hypothetical protein B0H13DRAFT_1941238 [Mycena leptocephala]
MITTGHLGDITKEPHWVSLVVDLSKPAAAIRYGDSFGSYIPAELLEGCRWWIGHHTRTRLASEDLPIADQEDGFSCGMLVDNSQQHFVDPSVPLSTPSGDFAQARLEMFNKLCQQGLERVCVAYMILVLVLTTATA